MSKKSRRDHDDLHNRPRDGRPIAKKLELTEPITSYGKEVAVLEFEKPRASHLRAAERYQDQQVSQGIVLIGELCDLPEAAVERLDANDFTRACEIIDSFLTGPGLAADSSSQSTGGEDS